jgi:hypothetical protein
MLLMSSVVLKKSIENIQIKFILKLFILDILVSLVQLELLESGLVTKT